MQNDTIRDENMDIMSFINMDSNVDVDVKSDEATPVIVEKDQTPLDRFIKSKEKNGGGIEVHKDEYKDENDPKELKNFTDNNPQREKEFDDYKKSMDQDIEASRLYVRIRPAVDQLDDLKTMEELRMVSEYLKDPTKEIPQLQYLRRRTEEELAEYDRNKELLSDRTKLEGKLQSEAAAVKNTETTDTVETEIDADESKKIADEKMVTVLIDKTGLGGEPTINFTDEERQKLVNAEVIKVASVTPINIETANIMAPEKSYTDYLKERESNLSSKKIPLPFSGYTCIVTGLGAYEVADLIINEDDPSDYETNLRKFSLVYNAISWFSTDKIKTFDDFLKNTSHFDWDLLQYALVLASYPDEDQMPIECGKCHHTFTTEYSTASLLDYSRTAYKVKEKMSGLLDIDPKEFENTFDNSTVNKYKSIPLPNGYRVDIGTVSLYDYLYDISPEIRRPKKGEELSQIDYKYNVLLLFLEAVRAIYVPAGNGKYYKYSSASEMVDIIKGLDVRSFKFLSSIIDKVQEDAQITFSIRTPMKCPECGNEIKYVPIDMYSVVFYKGTNMVEVDLSGLEVF